MKIIKTAISLNYFTDKLKFSPELSKAIHTFLSGNIEANSLEEKFYLSKIRATNPDTKEFKILRYQDEIIKDPSVLRKLYPFEKKEKEEHPFEKEICNRKE